MENFGITVFCVVLKVYYAKKFWERPTSSKLTCFFMVSHPIKVYGKFYGQQILQTLYYKYSIDNKYYKLKIRNVIADAPARAWLKCVNQHGNKFACERWILY